MPNFFTKLKTTDKRHYVRVGAFVVLGGAVVGLIIQSVITFQILPGLMNFPALGEDDYSVTKTLGEEALLASGVLPTKISIPSVGIVAEFESPLGLTSTNAVGVPVGFDTVGWYQYGPRPGEVGPAVILGHVDSKRGPAVFYSLGQVKSGDEVVIENSDGTASTFVITHLERYEQSDFPTELVYGDTQQSALRLVTCSGRYDKGEQRYTHNLVVYAELKE